MMRFKKIHLFLWNFYLYRFHIFYLSNHKIMKLIKLNKINLVFFYAFDLDYWKQEYKKIFNFFDAKIEYVELKNLKNFIKNCNNMKYLIVNNKNHAMYYYHYMRKNGVKSYLIKKSDFDNMSSNS